MSRRKKPLVIFRGRRVFVLTGLMLGIAVLLGQVVWLLTVESEKLTSEASKRKTKTESVKAYRGMILDRDGRPLAISAPAVNITADPKRFMAYHDEIRDAYDIAGAELEQDPDNEVLIAARGVAEAKYTKLKNSLRRLENMLGLEPDRLLQTLSERRNKEYHLLARLREPEIGAFLAKNRVRGFYTRSAYRRFYPAAETAGQLVGFTDPDGRGLEGVERSQNEKLAGKDGKRIVARDMDGRRIETMVNMHDREPGQDVVLSVDKGIQFFAYKALKEQAEKLSAKSGSVVVLDAHSGEILAMANWPSFNPNNRNKILGRRDLSQLSTDKKTSIRQNSYRNRAVTDVAEPGSTVKPLTMAAALEARVLSPDVSIETSPGRIEFKKAVVKDPKNYGAINLAQILAKSSNVGASKVALLVRPRDHWMFLHKVGFGRDPSVGLPGELPGKLSDYSEWGPVDRASHGYGYGFSASLLQLAQAYSPFATGGLLVPGTIFRNSKQPVGQPVMSASTARAVLRMMEAVVDTGTGRRAAIDGYRVAGKTGTALKWDQGYQGYNSDLYITSFIGIAPASRPRLVVAVQLDEPKVQNSGGRAAAPVFQKIMQESLRLLDIPPDDLPELKAEQSPSISSEVSHVAG